MSNLGVNMSDDREFGASWNKSFTESKESYRKIKTEDDKKAIEKYSLKIKKTFEGTEKEKWEVTFFTKFGECDAIFFPANGKWHKARGKARGKGAVSMLNYFNPISK